MKIFLPGFARVAAGPAFAVAAALTAAPTAFAADMPAQAVYAKVPVPAVHDWTGCYLGLHAGGGVMNDTFVGTTSATGGGGLAGGQAGCNYQAGQFVFGLEGEGAWSGITDRFNEIVPPPIDDFSIVTTTRNRWDADLAVRLGFAIDRALIYGKVGGAVGSFDFRNGGVSGTTPSSSNGHATFDGLLLGGGLEYAFAPNWSAKIEYDFIDFVGKDVRFDINDNGVRGSDTLTHSAMQHIVKVGVNYRLW